MLGGVVTKYREGGGLIWYGKCENIDFVYHWIPLEDDDKEKTDVKV